MGRALLAPTRLYVTPALAAVQAGGVHGIAHITGGGLSENIPRVVPEGLGVSIDLSSWELPALFKWLGKTGGMESAEMLKTFNCGIGMAIVVDAQSADDQIALLRAEGEQVTRIGTVTNMPGVTYLGLLM